MKAIYWHVLQDTILNQPLSVYKNAVDVCQGVEFALIILSVRNVNQQTYQQHKIIVKNAQLIVGLLEEYAPLSLGVHVPNQLEENQCVEPVIL